MNRTLAVAIVSGVFSFSSLAQDVLFDIDFSEPHRLGDLPVVNDAISTPSGIVSGRPEIVTDYGGFDRALLLNTQDAVNGYEQIRLDVNQIADVYYFSADIYTEKLVGSDNKLSIFFDAPQTRSVSFHGMGFINASIPEKGSRTISSLKNGIKQHIDIEIDTRKNLWTVYLDGKKVYENDYFASELSAVRINLLPWGINPEETERSEVAIDNIRLFTHQRDVDIVQSN